MLARSIGEQLAELRWRQRFTLAELADVIGLSTEYLRSVEAGELDLDLITLNRLTEILGIDCSELFQLAEDRTHALEDKELFDLTTSHQPKPQSVEDYRSVLAWYKARQQQYAWLRAKREQTRKNLAKQRDRFRQIRIKWKTERGSNSG